MLKAVRVAARMTALRPGQSPPPVRIPTRMGRARAIFTYRNSVFGNARPSYSHGVDGRRGQRMRAVRGRARTGRSMSVRTLVQRATDAGVRVASALRFLAPLLTRITLGHAFFLTGRGKLANFEDFVGFMAARGIPFPEANAAFVARLEYYGA